MGSESFPEHDGQLLVAQNRILEMVATAVPLADTLDELCLLIERQESGLRCGILIVNDDGTHFRCGSGPNLPEKYQNALDGVTVKPPYVGSCGEVADRGVAISVPDVAADERYSPEWRELLLTCGLRAVYSIPVRAANGTVLASFAFYHDTPRDPKPRNPGLIAAATHLAALALERARYERTLRESEARLSAEFAATRQLQEISSVLIQADDVNALYDQIVQAAVALAGSDAATMQVFDQEQDSLNLVAWTGLHPESAKFWERVHKASASTCGVALASHERVVVQDVETSDFLANTSDLTEYRRSGMRAVQSTPLLTRAGTLIGMISNHWREPRQPSEDDLRLLDVLARQAADLIERAQAEAATREHEARQAFLLELGDRLRELIDPGEILLSAAEALGQKLNAARVRYLEIEGAEGTIRQSVEWSNPAMNLPDLGGEQPLAAIGPALLQEARAGRILCVEDVRSDPRTAAHAENFLRFDVIAGAAVPLRKAGRLVGGLSIHMAEPHRWNEEELSLLRAVAERTWSAAERARSEALLRTSRDQNAALYQLTNRLYRADASSEVYDAALDAISNALQSDAASVLLFDDDGAMRFVAWRGLSEGYRQGAEGHSPWKPGDRDSEPIFVNDIDDSDEPESLKATIRGEGIRALAFIPLVENGAVIGKFMTYYQEPHTFSEGEIDLALTIARQLGFSIARQRANEARLRAEQELRDSQGRLRQIIDGAKEYAIVTLDNEARLTSWNEGAKRLLGYDEQEILGRHGHLFFTPEDRNNGEPECEMRQARQEGRASNERWHMRKDGSRFWGSGVMLPIEDGGSDSFVKIFRDQTEQRRANERQQLLINELNHRVKNTLATVQSIASQSLRNGKDQAELKETFENRIGALAASHDVLTQESWQGAELHAVISTALAAFRDNTDERFDIDGPLFYLAPKPALSFSMALHELATNAVKFGALSNDTGRIEISWTLEDGNAGQFRFRWKETGGPPVTAPERRGFGSRLIESGLSAEFGGQVWIEYASQGVRCTIDAPAAKLRGDNSFLQSIEQ